MIALAVAAGKHPPKLEDLLNDKTYSIGTVRHRVLQPPLEYYIGDAAVCVFTSHAQLTSFSRARVCDALSRIPCTKIRLI